MEEMELRVRKLREKRDALRHAVRDEDDPVQTLPTPTSNVPADEAVAAKIEPVQEADDEEDDEDADDWYS
jgi:zinc finger protein 830